MEADKRTRRAAGGGRGEGVISSPLMLDTWLIKLANLRVDRASKTPAPHKPLLLLAILDQIEQGAILSNIIRLTPELAFRFLGYWEVVSSRGRNVGRVELPFFYLRSDGLLRHIAYPGLEAALESIRPTSVELLNRVVSHAEMPEELFSLMQNKASRDIARRILISGDWFFPSEKIKLEAMLGLEQTNNDPAPATGAVPESEESKQGRDIKFRLQLIPLYRYSCVLCGMKVLLPSGVTMVEAAHIHPFSASRNDDISNGMALCRNHHWAFDQGLWTLGVDYKVLVATGRFSENAPKQVSLSEHSDRQIDFSWIDSAHWPSQISLEWHRKNKFIGALNI
ncbi:MAG: HNH endonuclease [Nitrospirae bacterium]|nr:HNH endonuclease [Nitrospirota bacterium]